MNDHRTEKSVSNLTMFGIGAGTVILDNTTSRPLCAKAINFRDTKKPYGYKTNKKIGSWIRFFVHTKSHL